MKPNAKLMLLAAAGAASAGQAALQASRVGRQDALERGRAALAERAEQKGIAVGGAASSGATAVAAASMQQRAATWQKTGIAALRDLRLAQLPPELFNVASGVHARREGDQARRVQSVVRWQTCLPCSSGSLQVRLECAI